MNIVNKLVVVDEVSMLDLNVEESQKIIQRAKETNRLVVVGDTPVTTIDTIHSEK